MVMFCEKDSELAAGTGSDTQFTVTVGETPKCTVANTVPKRTERKSGSGNARCAGALASAVGCWQRTTEHDVSGF